MFKKINICSLGFFNYDQVISILGVEHVRTRDRCRNVGLKPLTGNPAYGWVTRSPDVEGAQPSTHIILKIIGKPSTASSYFSPLLLPLPLSSDSSFLSSTLLSLVRLLFHPPLYPICSLLFCSFHIDVFDTCKERCILNDTGLPVLARPVRYPMQKIVGYSSFWHPRHMTKLSESSCFDEYIHGNNISSLQYLSVGHVILCILLRHLWWITSNLSICVWVVFQSPNLTSIQQYS